MPSLHQYRVQCLAVSLSLQELVVKEALLEVMYAVVVEAPVIRHSELEKLGD